VALGRALELGAFASPLAAHAAARALQHAQRGAGAPPPPAARRLSTAAPDVAAPTGPAAFVFDVDGVLVRGARVLPAAREAMQLVRGEWGGRSAQGAGGQPSRRPHPTAILAAPTSPLPPSSATAARGARRSCS
jgi:hypothetical protein